MDKKAKILVVDDEDRNLRLMKLLLTSFGYDVLTASNGGEALEKVHDIPPDVILLDIMMPQIDGLQVARQLKREEETKIIPIVMVTALNEVEDRVKALEAGADDFLSKPVDKIELRARVQSLVMVKACNDHMRNYQKELEAEVAKRTEQLRQALKKLKEVSLESICHLCRAAEYRDENTGDHIKRMSRYASAVARKMGLNKQTVEDFLYTAPMHDAGKIGIPDHILLKSGKLNDKEWQIMKQHTIIGAQILAGSGAKFIKLAQTIALTHHEKWDGSGYPKGLKGPKIPLVGRIAAIADVFDALTSKRPYRMKPFSLEEAFNYIKKERGRHFDPKVVDAFFAAKDEILLIRESDNDNNLLRDGLKIEKRKQCSASHTSLHIPFALNLSKGERYRMAPFMVRHVHQERIVKRCLMHYSNMSIKVDHKM
ncbi:MAG: two-component system response regulator [Deltaproteobacteria bacterium]|nr:two-component system response regulator [Deltaproteobacteria bacterium]